MCGHNIITSDSVREAATRLVPTGGEAAKTPPHSELSELLYRDTGVSISPALLRIFLCANWRRVSTLAHRIHETHAADERRADAEPEGL